jgi:hypothetical protein
MLRAWLVVMPHSAYRNSKQMNNEGRRMKSASDVRKIIFERYDHTISAIWDVGAAHIHQVLAIRQEG